MATKGKESERKVCISIEALTSTFLLSSSDVSRYNACLLNFVERGGKA